MTVERLQSSDKRLIGIVILIAAASVIYTRANYRSAFPQASIDLRFSKDQITNFAQEFLARQGLDTEGFRNLTVFDPDERARFYLERELGLEEANRLMQAETSVWRWRARWFRPPDKEERIVYFSPQGRMVGFQHVIAEAAPGARLTREEAGALAEKFLREQTAKPHRLIEQQLQERPARHDHVFTWEQEDFRAKDATYWRTVVIQGDRLGAYSEFLHAPEQWQRDFAALRSSNELFQWIAEALFVLLGVAAIAAVILSLRRRDIPWRPLIALCSAIGALMVFNELNTLPFTLDRMPTSSPYHEMIVLGVLQAFGAGVGTFFYVILAGAAGEPLYRRSLPSHLPLSTIASLRALRTRGFFRACLVGYGFAAAHIAFVVAFYLVSRQLGAWSPQDVKYSDLLSTSLPWLYPLTISLLAATSEEFWFRLLAIPLLKRGLRVTWIAVVLPAFAWGFLHSNYPQQPGFVRGLEVGIIGVVAGYLMLRYGILSTLIWHYTVDAVLIGAFLFESGDWYFRISGAIVAGAVLFPLAVSLFLYRRNGGFEAADVPAGAAFVTEESPPPAATETAGADVANMAEELEPVRPVWRRKWLYIAAAVFLLLAVIARPTRLGDFFKVRLTAAEAAARADEALRSNGIDTGSWRRVAKFIANLNVADFEYVRRAAGLKAANEIVRERTISGVWLVRYLRPMESEEWRVYLDPSGEAYRIDHVLDEKAAGANLDSSEAIAIAGRYLDGVRSAPLADYKLVDSHERKFDHRTDHEFVWEHQTFRIGEATARMSVSVVGDRVSYYRRFLKLPEAWLRDFQRPRLQSYLVPALGGGIALPLLVVFVRHLGSRRHAGRRLRWKLCVAAAIVAALASALATLNTWPTLLLGYDTAKPLENYLGQVVLNALIVAVLAGLGIFLLALAADVFLGLAAGNRPLPRASIATAVAFAALLLGVRQSLSFIGQTIPGDRFSLPLWDIVAPESYVPALTVLVQSAVRAIALLCAGVILVSAAVRYARNRAGVSVIASCVVLLALAQSTTALQFGFHLIEGAFVIGLVFFLIRTSGVDLAAFGVALFWIETVALAGVMAAQPAAQLRWNGIAALLGSFAIGFIVLRWTPRSDAALSGQPFASGI
ncbi:MAG: CPBP family intramembrane metalloprotease [Bryobacteraceae bacterium]|nr:CPBP family intramembrane metalloprotease [Bryobacteraceae bacterium]